MTGKATGADQFLGLFSFNWLPALYAKESWLGVWQDSLPANRSPSDRLTHLVSQQMLAEADCQQRYLPWLPRRPWVLAPQAWLESTAREIALALASHGVRQALSYDQVNFWEKLLGSAGRRRALAYATELPALAGSGREWRPETAAELTTQGGRILLQVARHECLLEAGERQEADATSVAEGLAWRLALRFESHGCAIDQVDDAALADASRLLDIVLKAPTDGKS